MKKMFFPSIKKKRDTVFLLLAKGRVKRRAFGLMSFVLLFILSSVSVYSQQRITDNLKCTYVANSFG